MVLAHFADFVEVEGGELEEFVLAGEGIIDFADCKSPVFWLLMFSDLTDLPAPDSQIGYKSGSSAWSPRKAKMLTEPIEENISRIMANLD